jgi:hypothetical protein
MNFERTVFAGLERKIKEVYGTEPRFISHGNRLRLVSFLNKTAGGLNNTGVAADTLKYPILLLFLRSITANRESYNRVALQRRPLYSGRLQQGGSSEQLRVHKFVPTTFDFEFIHITPDFWSMMDFASLCIRNNAVQGHLSFTSAYDSQPIDVRVEVDDNVAIPEKDSSIEQTDWYETTTRLKVNAYVSEPLSSVLEHQVTNIQNLNVVVTTQPNQ